MRIRNPQLLKAAGLGISWMVQFWMGTVRYHYRPLGDNLDPRRRDLPGRYIYAFWHENMLLPTYHYCSPRFYVLTSQHADGEIVHQVMRLRRTHTIRGSTTRGGIEAVRTVLRDRKHRHLAVTPDGPRGPRRQVQPGIIYLAARTGMPIIPVGFAYHRPWRLRTWDRFAVPRPWSVSNCVTREAITVPADSDRKQLELYRQRVEEELLFLSAEAERRVAKGR
jgi:lysophospholipid acyltransferase (LPLAT)-like uncharacterized protein